MFYKICIVMKYGMQEKKLQENDFSNH